MAMKMNLLAATVAYSVTHPVITIVLSIVLPLAISFGWNSSNCSSNCASTCNFLGLNRSIIKARGGLRFRSVLFLRAVTRAPARPRPVTKLP